MTRPGIPGYAEGDNAVALPPDQRLLATEAGRAVRSCTATARDTWDSQPALGADGRAVIDGAPFGRTAVGLWELSAAAG